MIIASSDISLVLLAWPFRHIFLFPSVRCHGGLNSGCFGHREEQTGVFSTTNNRIDKLFQAKKHKNVNKPNKEIAKFNRARNWPGVVIIDRNECSGKGFRVNK